MSDVKPFVLDFDLVSGFCTSGKVKPSSRVSIWSPSLPMRRRPGPLVEGDPCCMGSTAWICPKTTPACSSSAPPSSTPERWGGYFMTKGHFHTILDTSEIYYGLSGHGMMLMETP